MRKRLLAAVAGVALAAVGPSAQETQRSAQTFRSGVDLLTIDVTAVDRQGKPVDDLRSSDFSVKVDGKSRPVVSATLVKVDRSELPALSADPWEALVTSNAGATPGAGGRRVVIAVDQTLIAPGSIQTVMRTAGTLLDDLAPRDYAAVLAFPEPGPRVDFTTDKAPARAALQRIVGQPQVALTTNFNLSLIEAMRIDEPERKQVRIDPQASVLEMWDSMGPMMHRVLERGCKGLSVSRESLVEQLRTGRTPPGDLPAGELRDCIFDLTVEATKEAQEIRVEATMSRRRLESYLKELATIDGPKTMVLVSAGLLADIGAADELARLAADARTTIYVIAVEHERERDRTDIPNGQVSMTLQDRAFELEALETVVQRTGGDLYQAVGNAEGAFTRLAQELTASYVVAVERRASDKARARIDVTVTRKGVVVRSPQSVTTTAAAAQRPLTDQLRDALGSPLPTPGVPLRMSTFARRDAANRYVVNLAAQVGEAGAAGGFGVGYAVYDEHGTLVASRASTDALKPSRAGEPLQYDAAVVLPPGNYSVRLAAVDGGGRRGSVVRRLELPPLMNAALMTSDLVVGSLAAEGGTMHPAVEPHIDGRLGAYLEIYLPESDTGRISVQLDVAEGDATPALTSATLNLAAGAQSNARVASGGIDVSLLPGRYLARATVRRDGVVVRAVSRPFVLERRAPGPATPARAATSLAPEVRARTASYVRAFVQGLSNVVGQEVFDIGGRKVISDFLLVQYPGAAGDFLTYRDALQVNGTPVPNREERALDLFARPAALVRDRVRQITLASEQHVPSLLNPIFVLAFLQADFQSRFALTAAGAGREWPSGVTAVRFVEMAWPTILRGGLAGDLDVPVRGTAWLEPETGRVLQTELQIPSGRGITTVTTTFRLDSRLQIMVPAQMRTQNPDGAATYSNFRRFAVTTDTTIPTQE